MSATYKFVKVFKIEERFVYAIFLTFFYFWYIYNDFSALAFLNIRVDNTCFLI